MASHIVRNDISKMSVDIIVNTANPFPVVGSGVDSVIHHSAGPEGTAFFLDSCTKSAIVLYLEPEERGSFYER